MTTIVVGELSRSFDPAVSEWGNPADEESVVRCKIGRERPELKHLSKGRKINLRDSVSKRRAKADQSKPDCASQEVRGGVAGCAEGLHGGN